MVLAAAAIVFGFVLLVWSADRFIDGAAATARHAGMPSLLIGMLVVGFGTSAPEMVVSGMAAVDGNPDLALGNALGSNIANTGLIVGLTALLIPLAVNSKIVRRQLPLLLSISALLGFCLLDGELSRFESLCLLGGFFALVGWSALSAYLGKGDSLEGEMDKELDGKTMGLGISLFWLFAGLVLLLVSSRILVWGAVEVAAALGVSDLIIGLTIVALGTSLPELAATVIAARKSEFEIAVGNIVGSNMFNLLAVVGIAGSIAPISEVAPEVLNRDWIAMMAVTIGFTIMAIGLKGPGRINRFEGALLLLFYIGYNAYLAREVLA